MVRLLIIGANGLIGRAVVSQIKPEIYWQGTYFKNATPGCLRCDILNSESIREIFEKVRPTCVLHCAQLAGGVNFCEENPFLAQKFHFDSTVRLGKECLRHNVKLVFISSECVFNGKKENYTEDDAATPLNIYGKYKAKSEEWISSNLKDYAIVRTMSVYGWDPLTKTPNAVMSAYSLISKGRKIHIPAYRWGSPTYVKDLAMAILELTLSKESGIFHVAGATFINRYEWLKKTCEVLGWDSSLLLPLDKLQQGLAIRPSKVYLDTQKFRDNFSTKLHTLEEGLELLRLDMMKEMVRNA